MAKAVTANGWNNGRPQNVAGLSRTNANAQPIDPGIIRQVTSGVRSWLGMTTGPGSSELPFFPPGIPMPPIAQGAIGRRFDYPTNYNATLRARSYEPVDFDTLRAICDPSVGGWDLIRLAMETRKDQMSKLTYSVLPRKPANQQLRPKSDPDCEKVESFLRRPDGQHSWADWVRMLVEEHLSIDAATIYCHKTVGGEIAKLELLDGALIKPILSYDGRRPESGPAYVQNLKGLGAVHYTADELIYAPRNPRVHKAYGYSCVEQVIVTANIGMRRQASQLGYFTDGTVPDAIAQVPADWSTQRIQEWQDHWDTVVNDAVNRRKLKFIPGGVQFVPTRNDTALTDQFDEWLARIVQYCFSLPPTPLVRMMNRATSESSYEESQDEGLQPLMMWVKNIIDDIIVRWFGFKNIEMVWDDIKKTDPAEKEKRDLPLVEGGIISRDDMRSERGIEPLGIGPVVQGIGPLGFMSVAAMIKAIANGWDLTGMPQPQMPMMGSGGEMMPGQDPAQLLGSGQDGDPLNGLPPEVLEALGVTPTPPEAPGVTAGGPLNIKRQTTPGNSVPDNGGPAGKPAFGKPAAGKPPFGGPAGGSNVVPLHLHPKVQAALKVGEAHAKVLAARMGGAK
jgi:hypothetical protein